jgi:hypothetical protein
VREVGLLGLCKFLVYVLLAALLAGKFFTGEWFWGGEADVRKSLWKLWPTEQRLFSESLLAEFDGNDPHKPLYLAVRYAVAFFFSSCTLYAVRVSAVPFCCLLPWPYLAWQGRAGRSWYTIVPVVLCSFVGND